jgi:hypothetical protein
MSSMRVTVIASPSYENHVAVPQHRAGYYANVEGPSRAVTTYRQGQNYIADAARDLPPSPGPEGHWSNVEQVKRMVFSG